MTTKQAQHTPGPWSYSGMAGDNCIMAGHSPNKKTIALVVEDTPGNRALLAAAPDLLAALQNAKAMLETASRYFPKSIKNGDRFSLLNVLANSINPAIAKAECN